MKFNKIITLLSMLFMCITITAYEKETFAAESVIKTIDYSKTEYWLSLPSSIKKQIDVFYLYPTSFQKNDVNEPNICEIDNPVMKKYSKLAFERQAAAFEPVGNIYAPYYRQADAAYCLSLPAAEQEKVVGSIPKSDAFAAFDHYIKKYNNGRPFILAGHSQGSNILLYLLSEYMKKNPEVYSRMIAAYVIGYSVTGEYLAKNPHLKFAESAGDTGVIISYNTEAPEVIGTNPVLLPGAIAINPINWSRDEKLAKASENLGSIVLSKEGKIALTDVKNYADARVDKKKGAVICSTVDVKKLSPGNKVFGKGVYHSFDYPFYFNNIRENAITRTKNFLKK
ncbi:MAG: DUF3089 domain-containing protein [Candidatus Wallbacteria bacterium]